MKVVNVCISAPYMEGFSYQENILTDYLLDAGIATSIIGSDILPSYSYIRKIKKGIYFDNGKKLIRIKCFKISSEYLIPFGLYRRLIEEKPDVIFHHNLNCTSLILCVLYRITHPDLVLIVDNHADSVNCSKRKLWQLIYHKTLIRMSAKFSSFFVRKFYGVTYSRCDYLHEVYGVKLDKIDFLPIGTDIKTADTITNNKIELRKMYNLPDDAFIFVSGGKMGQDKGTDILIKAINQIQLIHEDTYLVLFGSFTDEITQELASESKIVIFKGWCDHLTSLSLLKASDVAVWPKLHTTLIEDAISVNTPLLIRKNRTTEHLIDGNGIPLESSSYEELYLKAKSLVETTNKNCYREACNKIREKLSYKLLVEKIINDLN